MCAVKRGKIYKKSFKKILFKSFFIKLWIIYNKMLFLLLYLYYLIIDIYLAVVLSTVSYSAILNILLGCWVLDLPDQERLLNWFLTTSAVNHAFRTALTCSIWFAWNFLGFLFCFIYNRTHYEYPWYLWYIRIPLVVYGLYL